MGPIMTFRNIQFIFLAVFAIASLVSADNHRIINGVAVPPGVFEEVVTIRSNSGGCTATIIGPRVALTTSHCGVEGGETVLKVKGKEYLGTHIRSPYYPHKDHDIGLVITEQNIKGIKPASIGGKASIGDTVFMLGYGCTHPGGGGGNDGILRIGESQITRFSGLDFVSHKVNGGALCFGDSGGPTYIKEEGQYKLLGVNSKGNIKDTNYHARTDLSQTMEFFQDIVDKYGVNICGFNANCEIPPIPPVEVAFEKDIFSYSVKFCEPFYLDLNTLLVPHKNKTDLVWTLGEMAPDWLTLKGNVLSGRPPEPSHELFTIAVRAGGSADAAVMRIRVKDLAPAAPTCSLEATPSFVEFGDSVTLKLQTRGEALSAQIDGFEVHIPTDEVLVTPAAEGVYVAQAVVEGPGGTGTCTARYATFSP